MKKDMDAKVLILSILAGILIISAFVLTLFRGEPAKKSLESGRLPAVGSEERPIFSGDTVKSVPFRAKIISPEEKKTPDGVIDLSQEPALNLTQEEVPKRGKIEEFAQNSLDLITNQLKDFPISTPLIGSKPSATTTDFGRGAATTTKLTEEEVFDILWPPDFRARLMSIQNLEIIDGVVKGNNQAFLEGVAANEESFGGSTVINKWYIPPEDRAAAFKTDEDVYKALRAIARQMHLNGMLNSDQLSTVEDTLNHLLPGLIDAERKILLNFGRIGLMLPGEWQTSFLSGIRKFARTLLDWFMRDFLIKSVYAAWVRQALFPGMPGDCYKDDVPMYPVPGFNLAAPCCNCGLKCGNGCVFIPDCGEQGTRCNVHFGCLNLMCREWPNAIWDPQTTICGCG
jgi:hypothetical protein